MSTIVDPKIELKKRRHLQSYCYFAVYIALGLYAGSVGPALVSLAKQVGMNVGDDDSDVGPLGFIWAARSLGATITAYIIGTAMDHVKQGHRVLIAIWLAAGVMEVVITFIPNLYAVIVLSVFMGLLFVVCFLLMD